MSHRYIGGVACAFALIVLGGCGGNDDETTSSAAPESAVPAELVGTYERTVKADESTDLPEGVWKIALGPAGEFFIVPPGETGFFNSPVVVDGDELEIPADPEAGCTGVGRYSYVAASPRPGGKLTFSLVSDELCPDRTALLTGRPFIATD